jgi:hypothetical protein
MKIPNIREMQHEASPFTWQDEHFSRAKKKVTIVTSGAVTLSYNTEGLLGPI